MKYLFYILSVLSLNFFAPTPNFGAETESPSTSYSSGEIEFRRGDGDFIGYRDRPDVTSTMTDDEADEYNETAWGRS